MSSFKIFLIFSFLVYFVVSMTGCADRSLPTPTSSSSSSSSRIVLPAQCSPASLDLGELSQGEIKNGKFIIFNNSKNKITIDRIDMSCDCLSLKPQLSTILAGGNTSVDVSMNSAKEPDFAGILDISVEGYAKNGDRLFETRIRINVISRTLRSTHD
jgi:Protein of unknown function (DUF1573)